MHAGSDSDRGGVRFERGLYVGLAAAAAAVGMTTAAYLTTQHIIQHLREEDIQGRFHNIQREIKKVIGNPTIASVPVKGKERSELERFDKERDAWHAS